MNAQTIKPPQNWFEERLKNGNCLILLDGLDEMAAAGLPLRQVQIGRFASDWYLAHEGMNDDKVDEGIGVQARQKPRI